MKLIRRDLGLENPGEKFLTSEIVKERSVIHTDSVYYKDIQNTQI